MEKIVYASSLCHEKVTPWACLLRLEHAKEKGWTVLEVPPGNQPGTAGGGDYFLVDSSEVSQLRSAIDPPLLSVDATAIEGGEKIGLGSAFLLVILILGGLSLWGYFSKRYASNNDEYSPRFVASPWENPSLNSSQDGIPLMQEVYPLSARPSGMATPGVVEGSGWGVRLSEARAETLSCQPPPTPPTHQPHLTPPTPHHAPAELAPELAESVLRLLPFDPRKDIALFEYDCFKEVKRLIPDMTQEKIIYLLWAVRKSGTDEKYKLAKARYDTFLGNWKAFKTEH